MQCQSVTVKGEQCKSTAVNGSEYCSAHLKRFCRYCGKKLTQKEISSNICNACGGTDKIQLDNIVIQEMNNCQVSSKDIINKWYLKESEHKESEYMCDICHKWVSEHLIINGYCVECAKSYKRCSRCGKLIINDFKTLEDKYYCDFCFIIKLRDITEEEKFITARNTDFRQHVLEQTYDSQSWRYSRYNKRHRQNNNICFMIIVVALLLAVFLFFILDKYMYSFFTAVPITEIAEVTNYGIRSIWRI